MSEQGDKDCCRQTNYSNIGKAPAECPSIDQGGQSCGIKHNPIGLVVSAKQRAAIGVGHDAIQQGAHALRPLGAAMIIVY
jgi:hypothetical protein